MPSGYFWECKEESCENNEQYHSAMFSVKDGESPECPTCGGPMGVV